ncbi:MAG: hypothetical protein RI932_1303, partial [Pseudomonadota bacterium]
KRNAVKSALLGVTCFIFLACSHEKPEQSARIFEAWDVINEPTRFGRNYEVRFRELPLAGGLNRIPWSDSYWATQRAGIAFRWMNPVGSPFAYQLHSRQTLAAMSQTELAALSPAEKLDIFAGRFDFPTVKSERKRTYPGAAAWEGLCHGWAPAALEFTEPKPVTLKGPGGIKVPFGSSDVKALLSWHMATRNTLAAVGLGARCNTFGVLGLNSPPCRDSNAGAFHIVLANQLGILREGFIADIARMGEVWNQPIYRFKSREIARQGPSPGSAPGTTTEISVETEMHYGMEVEPHWNALGQLVERPAVGSVVYRYRLEVDAQGRIRGGVWLQDARPDFIWLQQKGAFTGSDAAIRTIYEASIR